MNATIAVTGARGHTGRFVVAELLRRGDRPIPITRDVAPLDDPAALDTALTGAQAVINCAGPFAATAVPVVEAAVRAGIPYLDVTAELEVIADLLERFRQAPVLVVPSMAFFGGLGDLLATAAVGDWPAADRVTVAYDLSSWRPTTGTRRTGQVSAQRRGGRRLLYTGGRLEYRDGPAPEGDWDFPAGRQRVITEFTMADSVTIPAHLSVGEIATCMTVAAVADLRSPDTAPPAVDEPQTFVVDVVAERDGQTRRATATGRDIYASTAPLVVEAAHEALTSGLTGAAAPGAVFALPTAEAGRVTRVPSRPLIRLRSHMGG
jgi:hypothetical protein